MGAWPNTEIYYHLAPVAAFASIVVTAVYILRATGQSVMGPVLNEAYLSEKDAAWNERSAAVILVAAILVVGLTPFLLGNLIAPGTEQIMQQLNKLALN